MNRTLERQQSGPFSAVWYGDCRISQGNLGTDRKFTSRRLDVTGLYYYNARYYDPTIARFISPDVVVQKAGRPQNLNRYSYVLNNPLRYTDPTGLLVEFRGEGCVVTIGEGGNIIEVVSEDGGITAEVLLMLDMYFAGRGEDTEGIYRSNEKSSDRHSFKPTADPPRKKAGDPPGWGANEWARTFAGGAGRTYVNPEVLSGRFSTKQGAVVFAHEVHHQFFGDPWGSQMDELLAWTFGGRIGLALGLTKGDAVMAGSVVINPSLYPPTGGRPSYFLTYGSLVDPNERWTRADVDYMLAGFAGRSWAPYSSMAPYPFWWTWD